MFWTIFTVLMVLSVAAIVVGVNNYEYEWMVGGAVVFSIFMTMVMLGPLACETESKVSDKEQVCFEMPIFTKQSMFIYTNDGAEIGSETIKDAHFPYEQARCYKRNHFNHYGNVIGTSYTFEVGGNCKQSRTYYITE